ncbi:hypothetical protein BRADI_3g07931v3 [Brachypodium distachyon]|uniref:Uncharacterized protein n=1 Tax=Brachypodium distachyon TaxID=15368 RepID=A0A0Q3F730_BRADI|nr:hypothetical protein BRADI_3g07931v3 [Brachypodium distachyon]
MQCRCVGCASKVEKAMASIGSFGDTESPRALPMAEEEDKEDVKIVCPDPPAENHDQKIILVLGSSSRACGTTASAPPLPDKLS